ncbi:MAG TPA: ABC transporter ATP-binding protein [Clostridiales bacterium]|nr:ABC transporter ATP-binding protein [Clostridium sp.]MEE1379653.1 ABC transporter ATP-binding protein [Clostridia bacterium]CDE54153.1 aBC transporter ATP-binding protein [Clostridium sp. CAG:269]HCQ55368.1 ABC transporter ATP-binding protein [Clostridiales bacterium]
MLKLIKNFTKKEWILALICLVLVVTQVWLELKMPDYMSEITKLVQTEGSQMKDILVNGGYMLTCALGSLVAAVITGYITSRISSNFSKTIRKKLFNKVEDLAMQEVKQFSTSSLITRTTNDITQIEMLIAMGLQLLIKAPITAIWAITKILNKSWQWSAITAVAVAILMTTIAIIMVIVLPRFKKVQKLIDKLNGVTRENLTGIRVVRAFNAEQYQEEKFDKANNNLTNQQLFNQKVFAVMQPMMYIIMYMVILSIYYVGAYLIKDAGMADKISLFGDMVVFSSYAMQVIMSFLMLAMIFMMLPRAQVSANRINEVLDTEISIKDGKINTKTNNEVGTVEFKNVSFKYPDADEYLLKDISFKANKGDTVAFIGSTGSGKSTLINLIPRFYDATEGEVLVDGINVKNYTQEFLHDKIGYVPQKAVMFNGTVKSNISYGDNGKEKPTDEQIKKAIEVAQGTEFVEKMDGQYDAHMAQGGTNVSGGQKQRLSIARAIARNPEIYIFDDSFSALDYKTDSVLRKELKKYTSDATSLIVAQRIGTIMNADQIVVLDNGVIVGKGTHKELLKTCEVYKQIALSQLSKEELENG